jgi:hypothetical protein
LFEDPEHRYRIWVRTWSEILRDAKARLEFFRRELNFEADNDSAMRYLRETHERYLPTTASVAAEAEEGKARVAATGYNAGPTPA